jgi:SP family general alpha glucoside:H+ symporter-like MFS transporter
MDTDNLQVGCIIGLIINGYITEWIGYKKTMVVSMIVMIGTIFIPFFSTSLEMFLVGAILQGLPWYVEEPYFYFYNS